MLSPFLSGASGGQHQPGLIIHGGSHRRKLSQLHVSGTNRQSDFGRFLPVANGCYGSIAAGHDGRQSAIAVKKGQESVGSRPLLAIKKVIANYCRLSVLGSAVTFDVAPVTEAMANDRGRATYENGMQELTRSHQNDQRRLTSVQFQTLAQVPPRSSGLPTWTTLGHDVPTKMIWKTSVVLSAWLRPMNFAWRPDHTSSPGAPSSSIAVWRERRSGANWPRWPASWITSWKTMRSLAAIPCRREAAKDRD